MVLLNQQIRQDGYSSIGGTYYGTSPYIAILPDLLI